MSLFLFSVLLGRNNCIQMQKKKCSHPERRWCTCFASPKGDQRNLSDLTASSHMTSRSPNVLGQLCHAPLVVPSAMFLLLLRPFHLTGLIFRRPASASVHPTPGLPRPPMKNTAVNLSPSPSLQPATAPGRTYVGQNMYSSSPIAMFRESFPRAAPPPS